MRHSTVLLTVISLLCHAAAPAMGEVSIAQALDNELSWVTNQSNATAILSDDAVDSGDVVALESMLGPNFIETTVTGPGVLRFQWKQLSSYNERLALEINGRIHLVGTRALNKWSAIKVELAGGTHTLRWLFDTDSDLGIYAYSGSGGANAYIDAVSWMPGADTPLLTALDGVPGSVMIAREYGNAWTLQSTGAQDGVDAAVASPAPNSGTQLIVPQIEGPGTIRFWWRAGPGLRFSLGYNLRTPVSLNNEYNAQPSDWELVELTLPPGWHDFFINSENLTSRTPSTPSAVDNFAFIPTRSIDDGLDNDGALQFTTGGNIGWSGVAMESAFYDGDAIRTNDTSNPANAWIEATVHGPGTIYFAWLTNNKLSFALNDTEMTAVRFLNSFWEQLSYQLPSGTHTLRWTYDQPQSNALYDYGFLDAVQWVTASPSLSDAIDLPDALTRSKGAVAWQTVTSGTFDGVDAAACPLPFLSYEHSTSVLEIPYVQVPGTLKLRWKAGPYHALALSVEGESMGRIVSTSENPTEWLEAQAVLSPGTQTVTLTCTAYQDRLPSMAPSMVDAIVFEGAIALDEAVDTGSNLSFTTGGDQPWGGLNWIDAFDGVDAAVSGTGPNGTTSWLETTVQGPGTLQFAWLNPLGGLSLRINGTTELSSLRESHEWEQVSHTLGHGTHTLTWFFEQRNAQTNFGSLRGGYLDAIQWIQADPPALVDALDAPPTPFFTRGTQLWYPQSTLTLDGSDALAALPDDASDVLLHFPNIEGPGTLSFAWRSGAYQGLNLFINDKFTDQLSSLHFGSASDWEVNEYILAPGPNAVRIRTSISSIAPGAPTPSSIDQMSFHTPIALNEGLDPSGPIAVSTGGDAPWFGLPLLGSLDGADCAISGAIAAGQQSWIEATFSGPGTLSFAWQEVLADASSSLAYSVNGSPYALPVNSGDWLRFLQVFPEGTHTVRWTLSSAYNAHSYALMDQLSWSPNTQDSLSSALETPPFEIVSFGAELWYPKSSTDFPSGSAAIAPNVLYKAQSLQFDNVQGPGTLILNLRSVSGKSLNVLRNEQQVVSKPFDQGNNFALFPVFLQSGPNAIRIDSTAHDPMSIDDGSNAIDSVSVSAPIDLDVALENDGSLTFVSGGAQPWLGVQWPSAPDSTDAAMSGLFAASDDASWIETTVTGPGTLNFSWGLGGRSGAAEFVYELNGAPVLRLTQAEDWAPVSQALPSGTFTVRWRVKRFYANASDVIAMLDGVVFVPQAQPPLIAALDAAPSFPLTHGKVSQWYAVSDNAHDGTDALASAPASNAFDYLTLPTVQGPGALSFFLQTGPQQTFTLLLNGQQIDFTENASNAPTPWERVDFPIPAGSHAIVFLNHFFGDAPQAPAPTLIDQVSMLTSFEAWATAYASSTLYADDTDRDRTPLLMEYAANLNPATSDAVHLSHHTHHGLPHAWIAQHNGTPTLFLQFLQRINDPNIAYFPEVSSNADFRATSPAQVDSIELIDGTWQRVTATHPLNAPPIFGRVRVQRQ